MKKTLVALSLAALAERWPSEINISPAPIGRICQHSILKRGKSGVAAARRAARKKKGRLKK